MTGADAEEVVARLGREIAALTVRLAIAESRAEAAERALVDCLAEKEGDGADD